MATSSGKTDGMTKFMEKKKILIIADTRLFRDPRVLVQIHALKDEYELTCMGKASSKVPGVGFFQTADPSSFVWKVKRKVVWKLEDFLISLKKFSAAYFIKPEAKEVIRIGKDQAKGSWDLILCNDVDMLPAASVLSEYHGAALYLDAHEYTPRQWDGDSEFSKLFAFWDFIMFEYSGKVNYMTSVCQSIADKYEEEYGLVSNGVVMNLPKANQELEPSEVDASNIRLVHHGVLNRNRRLEVMVELMSLLDDRFSLDFYFVENNPNYLKELRDMSADNPRIRFQKAVPTAEIPKVINQYDMGLFPLSPLSTNYRFALPNKFFEFIQARLGVAIWPSVEMKNLLERHELGVVSDDFDVKQLAMKINELTVDDVKRFKSNSHGIAHKYHSQKSMDTIRAGVSECLSGNQG